MTVTSLALSPLRVSARRGLRLSLIVIGLGVASAPLAAQADTVVLLREPPLVFSPSRYAQPVREAPVSVTVITADEIRRFGYRTLEDVLSSVRGVHTRSDFNYEYVAARGLSRAGDYNSRFLVMVDGQRLNAPVSDASAIGADGLIDLEQVQQIEVIRGPGSALYGTNAVFGVINVVTKTAGQGTELLVEGGGYGAQRVSAAWARGAPNKHLALQASGFRQRGADWYYPEFDSPETNAGVAVGIDYDENQRVLVKGRWGDVALLGAFVRRRRVVPTAPYGTTFNGLTETIDQSLVAMATYTHTFDDLARLTFNAVVNRATYDGRYPYDDLQYSDFQRGTGMSLNTQYLRVFGSGHTIVLGVEGNHVPNALQGVRERVPPAQAVATFDDAARQTSGALFAQVEWRLGSIGSLYTGLRHDSYRALGGSTNPRLALVLTPGEHTVVRLLAGTAFRAPNPYELHYTDNGFTQKAPTSLSPERVESVELGIDRTFGPLTASASAYQIRASDLINLTVDPTDDLLVFANQGAPESRGIEVELDGQIGRIRTRASFAWQRAVEEDGSRPADSPRRLGMLRAVTPLFGSRASLALAVTHVGERRSFAGASAAAATITNLNLLARPFGSQTELDVGVRDLFAAGRVDPAGEEHMQAVLRQYGRSLRVGVRQRF